MKKTCVLLAALALAGCASPRGDAQTAPAKAPVPAGGPAPMPAQMPPHASPDIAPNIPPNTSHPISRNIQADFPPTNPSNPDSNTQNNNPLNTNASITENIKPDTKPNTSPNISIQNPADISLATLPSNKPANPNSSPPHIPSNGSSGHSTDDPAGISLNTPPQAPPNVPPGSAARTPSNVPARLASGMSAAVVSPLNDLNLVRGEIPALLHAAREAPYALPADRGCAALAADIAALDEVLGADLDAPASQDRPSLLARGVDEAGHAAVNAVQGAVSGAIPFRGWVRKLSGADRYARKVAAAVTAGGVRRAFLKGLSRAQDCAAAAPAPQSPVQPPLQAGAAGQAAAMVSMQEKAQPSRAAPLAP